MLSKSEIVDKQIIYRYSHSFVMVVPYIGLFKMLDGSCCMVIQQQTYGFISKLKDGLQLTQVITHDNVEWAHSKTIELDSAVFDKLYNSIIASLSGLIQANLSIGLDGDDLAIELKDFGGHKCEVRIWCPDHNEKENNDIKAIYAGFIKVLEMADLLDWYKTVI